MHQKGSIYATEPQSSPRPRLVRTRRGSLCTSEVEQSGLGRLGRALRGGLGIPVGALRVLPLAALATAVLASSAPREASGAVTARWLVDSYQEFHEGEVDGARLTSLGEIRPGYATERVDLDFGNAWSAVRGDDGTVYIGSDDDAKVFAVRGDEVRELAQIPDAVAVVSLAIGDDGTLFAGTMPEGNIYAISPEGSVSLLTSLESIEDEHGVEIESIWSLAHADGALFAGIGPGGLLVRVDPDSGDAEVAFDSGDKRIMALTTTEDGGVWFGTSDSARVYRHLPERGVTRAMADFAGNEVTALAPYRGGVVAAANNFEEPTTPRVKTAAAVREAQREEKRGEEPDMPEAGTEPGADPSTPQAAQTRGEGARDGSGAVFYVRGDSQLRQLHALTATYISALSSTEDDRVFVGAGDKGRVYLIDRDESVSIAIDAPQRLIAELLWDPREGQLGFVTADSTAYYRTEGRADQGRYESDVFDADTPARFGRLAWRSGGAITVETRSGNTAEPGPGWSDWERPDNVRNSGASYTGEVASPPARYFQYRATFDGDGDSVLRRTLLYYLPQNRPTRITQIRLRGHDPSDIITTSADSASPRSPVVTIRWDVDNPDDDDTAYRIEVRREGEARWRRLPTDDDPYTQTRYRWNTETFPDGYYRVRVTASDHLANAPERAQTHDMTSPLFLVDNQKPTIDDINVDYPAASARASDDLSPIAEMSYSVNDGPWQVGSTRDGLFDSLTEILTMRLPDDLQPGEHVLSIRVADEAGNIASASTTFEVP